MAGLAQTLNRYAYGVNNPTRWTDHSGNSPDGMSASDATRIGGGESSAGEFRADSQLTDDSYARGMAQQNAGRSYEENASEVPFTQIMREQTQARMFEAQVIIAHTIVNTALELASLPLRNPLSQALVGQAKQYINQQIDFEMGVEGAQPPSIRDLVVGTGKDLVTNFVIGKTIEYAAKGVGKVAEKVKDKVKGKAIGAAESAVRQETRSLTGGSGKGNGSGGSERGNGGNGRSNEQKLLTDGIDHAAMREQVRTTRASLPRKLRGQGNVAVAEIEIEGLPSRSAAHSRNIPTNPELAGESKGHFKTSEVANKNGELVDRVRDAENKILDDVAERLGDNPEAEGTIRLYTELQPCSSCIGVIDQFKTKYPKIDITVGHNNDVRILPRRKGSLDGN